MRPRLLCTVPSVQVRRDADMIACRGGGLVLFPSDARLAESDPSQMHGRHTSPLWMDFRMHAGKTCEGFTGRRWLYYDLSLVDLAFLGRHGDPQ